MDGLPIKKDVDSAPTVFAGYFDVCLAALTARGRGLDCLQPQRMAACLASKQTPYLSLPCLHGSERYAACFDEVVARTVRVSRPAVLSALLVIQLFGLVIPPPIFLLKSTKRSAAAISRSQRSFITFYGALRNILLSAGFPAMFHMIMLEQTFVNGPLQKISLADTSESNRFYPCFRESRDVVSADRPVC